MLYILLCRVPAEIPAVSPTLMENQVFEEVKVSVKERINWKKKAFMYVFFFFVCSEILNNKAIYIYVLPL